MSYVCGISCRRVWFVERRYQECRFSVIFGRYLMQLPDTFLPIMTTNTVEVRASTTGLCPSAGSGLANQPNEKVRTIFLYFLS